MLHWINTRLEYDERGKLIRVEGFWYRGPVARAGAVATRGEDWAFYNDDGSEAGATIIGSQNTNPVKGSIPNDTPFAFRFGVEETGGGAWANATPALQFNHNGAGLTAVTTTSSPIKAVALAGPGAPADGSSTTQRITGATIAVFKAVNDGVSFDGIAGGTNADFDADTNDGAEMLYGLQIDSAAVADNDTIVLHVQKAAGTDLNAYAQADPTITVEKSVGPTIEVPLKEFTRSGFAPAVAGGASVAVPLKSFTRTGYPPAVATGINVAVPSKAFTRTGFAPTVTAGGINIACPLKAFTRTGFAPAVASGKNVAVPLKSFTRTGFAPAVGTSVNVQCPLKSFTRSGHAPAVATGANVNCPLKTFTRTGFAPAISAGDGEPPPPEYGFDWRRRLLLLGF